MANSISIIKPYRWNGMWVFDDANVGLVREPFVAGADDLIDRGLAEKGMKNAEKGFLLLFSGDPFPSHDMELEWVRQESGGNVYRWQNQEGWLCPALFHYFKTAPRRIFVQMKDLNE